MINNDDISMFLLLFPVLGAIWGRLHHNSRMNDEQVSQIKSAVSMSDTWQEHKTGPQLVEFHPEPASAKLPHLPEQPSPEV